MLKRLIEVTLPLKEVSEQSAKESRDGHISTLHIWWARRPLGGMSGSCVCLIDP